jgi:hypothetical protein
MRKAEYHDPNASSSKTAAGVRLFAHSRSVTRPAVPPQHGLLATRVLSDLASESTEAGCGVLLVRGDIRSPIIEYGGSTWLPEALGDLSEIDDEAQESGHELPSMEAKGHAERILRSISALGPPAPSVYPTSDREVAIFFRSESRRASVLILCASDGQGACFAFTDGRGRRARYEDAGELPDDFVLAQLKRVV